MDAQEVSLVGGAASLAAASFLTLVGACPRWWRVRLGEGGGKARSWFEGLARRGGAAGQAGGASWRRAEYLSELPVLLDVVTLGLSAGLSFDSSLELYCTRYETGLSHAFSEAMLSWQIGVKSREEALAALADELEVAALRRFASVVGESLAFGTPLAESLERQAQVMREEQRSQVEEEIERVPVKMLVPLGTLIVPAMFLAILGPLLGATLEFG